jgi:hypothetical protein
MHPPLQIPGCSSSGHYGFVFPSITDLQIQADLGNEIAAGNNNLTAPNSNTLYYVFTPPGVVVDASDYGIGNSVNNFVAYHAWYYNATLGTDIVYAVIPYSDGNPNFLDYPLTPLQNMEQAASHEMAEAITDLYVNSNVPGWYDNAQGAEVGDLSNATWATLNGYVVQNLFSNATNAAARATGSNFFISSFQNPTEGQFSGVVATFVDTSGSGVLSSATVFWGDGTYDIYDSPIVQQVNSTTFQLFASHTYSDDEGKTLNPYIYLTLADGSQAADTGQVVVTDSLGNQYYYNDKGLVTLTDPAVIGSPVNFSATAGSAFNGAVATFTDPAGPEANDNTHYNATINWGDNTTTTGTINFRNGTFTVDGNHTYATSGTFTVTCTINHESVITTVQSKATVAAPPAIIVTKTSLNLGTTTAGTAGGVQSYTVSGSNLTANLVITAPTGVEISDDNGATFHASLSLAPTNGTVAATTIDVRISAAAAVGTVSGKITNTSTGASEEDVTVSGTVNAAGAPPSVTPPSAQNGVEGAATSFSLGSFTDSSGGPWRVVVGWGDGTSHTVFNLSATGSLGSQRHTYAEEGSYTITVIVTDTSDGKSGSASFQVAVSDPAVVGTAASVTSTAGGSFSATVATFTDPGGAEALTDYSATINWGDGSASAAGTITFSNGVFMVSGNHIYAAAGSYTITCTINHENVLTTVTSSASVSNLGSFAGPQVAKGYFFWESLGQSLIDSFGLTSSGLTLGQWLATTFPNLYGGANGAPNLSTFSDAQIAAYYRGLFSQSGSPLKATVLATALDMFASTASLGGSTAQAYGFTVTTYGLGAYSSNIGLSGAPFGVPNNTIVTVYQLMLAANNSASGGTPWANNPVFQSLAYGVFEFL